jgi:hypothetical protein
MIGLQPQAQRKAAAEFALLLRRKRPGQRQGDAAPTPVALGAATLRQQDAAAAPKAAP